MTNSVCGDRGATLSITISQIFDYLGATTMVMMSLYCMLVRISGRDQFGKIKSQRYVMLIYHLITITLIKAIILLFLLSQPEGLCNSQYHRSWGDI